MCKCKHKHVRFFHTPFTSSLRTHEQTVTEQTASQPRRQAGGPHVVCLPRPQRSFWTFWNLNECTPRDPKSHSPSPPPISSKKKERDSNPDEAPSAHLPGNPLTLLPSHPDKKKRRRGGAMADKWGPARSSTRGRFPAVAERMDGWDGSTIQTCPFPSTRCGDKQMGICFFSSSVFFLNKERERTVEQNSIHAAFCCCFALFPCSKYIDEWWLMTLLVLPKLHCDKGVLHHHLTLGIQISKFKNRSRSINWPQGTKVKS